MLLRIEVLATVQVPHYRRHDYSDYRPGGAVVLWAVSAHDDVEACEQYDPLEDETGHLVSEVHGDLLYANSSALRELDEVGYYAWLERVSNLIGVTRPLKDLLVVDQTLSPQGCADREWRYET